MNTLAAVLASVAVLIGSFTLGCSSPEERLTEHLARADGFLAEGNERAAVLELRNALKLAPTAAEVNYRLAEALLSLGDVESALFFYQETSRLDPEHDAARLKEAGLLVGPDPERARELAEGVLERNPDQPYVYVRLSELALLDVESEEALALALTAVELGPEDAEVWLHLGKVRRAQMRELHLRKQEPDLALSAEAIAAFERAAELACDEEPKICIKALINRAHAHADGGSHELASEAFRYAGERALALPLKQEFQLATVRGILLAARSTRRTGKDEDLMRWALSRMVEVAPEIYNAWERLAVLEEKAGEGPRSATLHRLVEQRPDDGEAHVLFARQLSREGQAEDAVRHLEASRGCCPNEAPILGALVSLHLAAGNPTEARALSAQLEAVSPDAKEAMLARAAIAEQEGRIADSAEPLRRLVLSGEGDANTFLRLAQAEHRLGNHSAASEAIRSAQRERSLTPPKSWLRLAARIEAAAGDWKRAASALRKLESNVGTLEPGEQVAYARALYALGQNEQARERLERAVSGETILPGAALLYAQTEGNQHRERARALLLDAHADHPENVHVIRVLVIQTVRSDGLDAGLEFLDPLLAKRPEEARLHLLRAQAVAGRDPSEAISSIERALEIDPDLPGGMGLYATLVSQEGVAADAIERLSRQQLKGRPGAAVLVARLLLGEGRQAEAAEYLEQALAERADLHGAKNDLAFILASQNRELERARDLASEALEARPNVPEYADTLGFVYLRSGLPEAAVARFDQALRVVPEKTALRASVQYRMSLALLEIGRAQDAIEALELALAGAVEFPEADAARTALTELSSQPPAS